MRFTIVTPSYNQADYLAEAIESVIGQEGEFSIDYIIVDGGSTDGSVDIIRHYAAVVEEKRRECKCLGITLRWLSEKDDGQADALMKGFRLATGDVLAWLNSDDSYLPGALGKVAALFDRRPGLSVVYGQTHYTDPAGVVIGRYPTGPFDYQRLATFNYICQPSTFFTKDAFEEVGGLDAALHFVMDYDLWIRLAKGFEFAYLQEFLANYRLHDESKTVSERSALANHEDALMVVRRHYGRAPLSRVYVCCHQRLSDVLPPFLKKLRFPLILSALPLALARYLRLNKGVHREDFRDIRLHKVRKLFRSRLDLYRRP
jgi:glycosyltransferase involved in cell wall biosynthesis